MTNLADASATVAIVCILLTFALEPKEPKKDGRFKTGYKNNATVPKKSESTIKLQKILLVLAAATGTVWYFVR